MGQTDGKTSPSLRKQIRRRFKKQQKGYVPWGLGKHSFKLRGQHQYDATIHHFTKTDELTKKSKRRAKTKHKRAQAQHTRRKYKR